MHIIKEGLDIEESLEKRIKNILKFLNIKSKIIKENIINIPQNKKYIILYIEINLNTNFQMCYSYAPNLRITRTIII